MKAEPAKGCTGSSIQQKVAQPYLNHSYDMAGVQQVNHSLGGKFEAHLHPESHAKGNQQQVLA